MVVGGGGPEWARAVGERAGGTAEELEVRAASWAARGVVCRRLLLGFVLAARRVGCGRTR